MIKICLPAIVYSVIVSTQIIIDIFKGYYQYALMKFIIMIIITGLINLLCQRELTSVGWIIVLVPYMYIIFLTFLLLYLFGFNIVTKQLYVATTSTTSQPPSSSQSNSGSFFNMVYPASFGDTEYVSGYTYW